MFVLLRRVSELLIEIPKSRGAVDWIPTRICNTESTVPLSFTQMSSSGSIFHSRLIPNEQSVHDNLQLQDEVTTVRQQRHSTQEKYYLQDTLTRSLICKENIERKPFSLKM
ncbi:hypothetical protein C8J55DRAFT_47667 [Lentinula edodes]|uniref:Uncharacterized protein n=1 Tax=Lentinula lateritia TaxID=40482 RepID=A0A9W9AHK9_9AGAR|nr:hypothetical protein C8J55DRAFT_47667 [Lentinula edodes]